MESGGTKRTERTGDKRKANDLRDRNESDRDELYVSDVIPLDLKSRMLMVHDNLGRLLKEAIPENEAWDNLGARPSDSMLNTLQTFSRMCYFLSRDFYDLEQKLEKEIREPRLDFANDHESTREDRSRRDARYDARRDSRHGTQRGARPGPGRDTQRDARPTPRSKDKSGRWSSQANTRVGQYL